MESIIFFTTSEWKKTTNEASHYITLINKYKKERGREAVSAYPNRAQYLVKSVISLVIPLRVFVFDLYSKITLLTA